jgi:hypothetical protein
MKKLSLILILFPLLSLAKIHTVDNTPGNGAMYNSINNAISAASSGDTIIVMPSIYTYSGFDIGKKLYIYSRHPHGGGVDPDRIPLVGYINFYSGCSGSKVSGFHMNPGGVEIGLNGSVNNIELSYNYLVATSIRFQGSSSNNKIINNVFIEAKYRAHHIDLGGGNNNIIRNNYFATVTGGNYGGAGTCFIMNSNSTNIITNNLFSESMTSGSNCTDGGFIFFRIAMPKFTTILCGAMSMAALVLIP